MAKKGVIGRHYEYRVISSSLSDLTFMGLYRPLEEVGKGYSMGFYRLLEVGRVYYLAA
jgi:hypothetical protein